MEMSEQETDSQTDKKGDILQQQICQMGRKHKERGSKGMKGTRVGSNHLNMTQ